MQRASVSRRLPRTDLAGWIAANDAVIERVNRKLPHGANWLASAEAIARGLRGFVADLHSARYPADAPPGVQLLGT
jgi:hypothetical protein